VSDPEPTPAGLPATLRATASAALTCGLLFGLADALVADLRLDPPSGLVGYLGCYAAAVMSYCALFGALLLPAALLGHLTGLLGREEERRLGRLLALGLALGLFAELYWWTRPYVFYGRSSVSPERLAAAAAQALVALGLGAGAARLALRLPRRVHAGARALAVLAILGGLVFVRAEAAEVARRGAISERNRDLPNVLLVIVDALRADHLGAYGAQGVRTPHLDALAARGVVVENCYAQAPYTLTSFGSILTGKYPRRHGLVAQVAGVQMKPNVTLPYHLKTAVRRDTGTRLRDEDYAAGAFLTGAVSHGSGLARGFDAYSEAMMGHDLVEIDSQWSRFRSETLLWLFKSKLQQRVDSSLVVSTALRWLRQQRGRRWMAMVHLYSTHTPYDPPEPYRGEYLDPTYGGPFSAFYAEHRYALEEGAYEPTEADVARIRDLYEGGAAQADAMIGELLEALEELGELENTLVIVTSDHGEDLGEWRRVDTPEGSAEMRYWEHNHMWQTNLRIPLLLANTRLLPHGARVTELIESVDLLPTVCDMLGLELPTEDGALEVDGRSFYPLVQGVPAGAERPAWDRRHTFAENNLFFSIQDARGKLVVPRRLLREEDPEALFRPGEWVRYYDLEADPEEQDNAFGPDVPRVRELWAALREYDASMPEAEYSVTTERDEEYLRLLESLGYAGGIEPEREGAAGDADGE
jgi:arylsulfatase A-like enzyme